ncbi:MAG: hypothetical protein AAF334_09285 [Pseudomonadota bacterium]
MRVSGLLPALALATVLGACAPGQAIVIGNYEIAALPEAPASTRSVVIAEPAYPYPAYGQVFIGFGHGHFHGYKRHRYKRHRAKHRRAKHRRHHHHKKHHRRKRQYGPGRDQ